MVRPENLRTVFMGTPEFALPPLEGLLAAGVNLVGVYTQPDRPKGRGKKLAASPVKQVAVERGLPVFQPQKLRDQQAVEELRALQPDLIIVVAYGQILPKAILDIPRYHCINIHASLLPKYRGAAPINKAIVDGETETGVTTMLMDVGLDTGDMLVKHCLTIGENETAGHLHDRLAVLGRDVMDETLHQLCAGTLVAEKQDDTLSCYAPMLKKEDGLIDWNRSAIEIHNQVRGLDPWPGAYTYFDDEVLKIAATTVDTGSVEAAGTIISVDKTGVQIACGEGVLIVGELQLPGRKCLSVMNFISGRPLFTGTRLG